MVRAGMIVFFVLLAARCSGANVSEPSADNPSETTAGSEGPRSLRVEQISSGAPGQGPERPRVVLAPSATALSRAIGARVPDSGEGTYLAAYWGEKSTGGYSLAVESARLEGNRVTIGLSLREPAPDAIVTQALTYPYAVAVVRTLDPRGKRFSFVDQNGRELGWSVRTKFSDAVVYEAEDRDDEGAKIHARRPPLRRLVWSLPSVGRSSLWFKPSTQLAHGVS